MPTFSGQLPTAITQELFVRITWNFHLQGSIDHDYHDYHDNYHRDYGTIMLTMITKMITMIIMIITTEITIKLTVIITMNHWTLNLFTPIPSLKTLFSLFTLWISFVNCLFDYTAYDNLELSKYSHHVQIMEEMAALLTIK